MDATVRIKLMTKTVPPSLTCEIYRNGSYAGKWIETDIIKEQDGIYCYLSRNRYEENDVLTLYAPWGFEDRWQTMATCTYTLPYER